MGQVAVWHVNSHIWSHDNVTKSNTSSKAGTRCPEAFATCLTPGAWPFARWSWYSFMDNGNIAEVTSIQNAIYLKFVRSPKKVNGLYFRGLLVHAFSKVWLKLNENYGSSSLLKMLTSGILQSAPIHLKLNSKNHIWKVPYITQYIGPQVPIFPPFCSTIRKYFKVSYFFFFGRSTKSHNLYLPSWPTYLQ